MNVGLRGAAPALGWWSSLDELTRDAVLYLLAALFAYGTFYTSTDVAQWHWGAIVCGPYAVAAVGAFVLARRPQGSDLRWWLLGLVIVTAVVAPLATEVIWRVHNTASGFAQPEVMVLERAAQAIFAGHSPYLAYWTDGHLVHAVAHAAPYESFFPYFPLISLFGIPAVVIHSVTGWGDARLAITAVTTAVTAIAIVAMKTDRNTRVHIIQFMIALPTGGLFLVTGGDDMPVLALMLLATVALQRRASNVAGLALGLAVAMKFTAWPLALVAIIVARDAQGRWSGRRVTVWIAVIAAATIGPAALTNLHGFVANVVIFPLGLGHIASPATSPLPGHLITLWWPALGHALAPVTAVVVAILAVGYARSHWPVTLSQGLLVLAWGTLALIMTASATRVGYLIYPVNLAIWSWAVREPVPVLAQLQTTSI